MAKERKETWHNGFLDERKGMMQVRANKDFVLPGSDMSDPAIIKSGTELWVGAEEGYALYLKGFVYRIGGDDPMINKRDPNAYKTEKMHRYEQYARNPFTFGDTTIRFNDEDMTVPLDHEGEPWVAVFEGNTSKGHSKYVFVPTEFKTNSTIDFGKAGGNSSNPFAGAVVPDPERRIKNDRDAQVWYIYDSGEGVRTNLKYQYQDFFSGRIYREGVNVLMWPEEADRAKREGYATDEPLHEVEALTNFDDEQYAEDTKNGRRMKAKPRAFGHSFLVTKERMEELKKMKLAKPKEDFAQTRLASKAFFQGKAPLTNGGNRVTR